MHRKFYGKALRNGWLTALLGLIMIISGFSLANSKKEMGYFALAAFGILFVTTGLVIVGVYSALERSVTKIFNDPSPLLHFTISPEEFESYAAAEAGEIRSMNRTSLYIALAFCVLVAVIGPFLVSENRYYLPLIALAIAVFLIISQWIITSYRVNKLMKSGEEVILTDKGAYAGGQFHIWGSPLSFLDKVQYFAAGKYKNINSAVIRISYSVISGTIVTPCTFVILIPKGLEEQAEKAVESLNRKIKG